MTTPKISIVSPDPGQAGMMCACLQDAGYQASSILLSEWALDDLCGQSPDLLLLEWQLPDPRTLNLVRRIRQDVCLADVPVILMGSGIGEEDALLSLDAGAEQCWREPFNPRVLVARVRAFLRRGKTAKEII